MEHLKVKTLENNATLKAMLELFEKAQAQGDFESLEINGTDMQEVKSLCETFEGKIQRDDSAP